MTRQTTLIKQAKERWQLVPPAQREELVAEMKSRPPGAAVIKLDKPEPVWSNGLRENTFEVKAQVVSIIFGMDIMRDTEKRYLFLSDIKESLD